MKCKKCGNEVLNYNFCPSCGEAITDAAKGLENAKIINARLETLLKVVDLVDDEKTLTIIKKLIENIKKNV